MVNYRLDIEIDTDARRRSGGRGLARKLPRWKHLAAALDGFIGGVKTEGFAG
jgi:hypothetical protein